MEDGDAAEMTRSFRSLIERLTVVAGLGQLLYERWRGSLHLVAEQALDRRAQVRLNLGEPRVLDETEDVTGPGVGHAALAENGTIGAECACCFELIDIP